MAVEKPVIVLYDPVEQTVEFTDQISAVDDYVEYGLQVVGTYADTKQYFDEMLNDGNYLNDLQRWEDDVLAYYNAQYSLNETMLTDGILNNLSAREMEELTIGLTKAIVYQPHYDQVISYYNEFRGDRTNAEVYNDIKAYLLPKLQGISRLLAAAAGQVFTDGTPAYDELTAWSEQFKIEMIAAIDRDIRLSTMITDAQNLDDSLSTKITDGNTLLNSITDKIDEATPLNDSFTSNINDATTARDLLSAKIDIANVTLTDLNNAIENGDLDSYLNIDDLATQNVDGVMSHTDKQKLDSVEDGATADQTGAEIKALYEVEADTNAYTDNEKNKLSNIEDGATADMTKEDIDILGIDAATINSFTVKTAVPVNAKFTDTIYVHPTGDGYNHIPSGGTSGQILVNIDSGLVGWDDLPQNGADIDDANQSSTTVWSSQRTAEALNYGKYLEIQIDSSLTSTTADSIGIKFLDFLDGVTFINWGDGSDETEITSTGVISHDYSNSGFYTITIRGGGAFYLGRDSSGDAQDSYHIKRIVFGTDFKFTSMTGMFQYCKSEFILVNTKAANTVDVTNMDSMFFACSNFNSEVSFYTPNLTSCYSMFRSCDVFNSVVLLNTSNVTGMYFMFDACYSFNQPLDFDTSNVTDMNYMFRNCHSFNQPVNFDTSNVVNTSFMFAYCYSFNQPLDFDTSNVTSMSSMFLDCYSFNQPVNFDTSNVVNTSFMFAGCHDFNQPLNFNMSNVTYLDYMFKSATSFNQDISDFNISNVTSLNSIFENCYAYNKPVSFSTSNITTMDSMFRNATSFNQDISGFDMSNVIDVDFMLEGTSAFTDHDLSGWDVSNVTNHYNFLANSGSGNTEPTWS